MPRRKGESDEDYLARLTAAAQRPLTGRNSSIGKPTPPLRELRKPCCIVAVIMLALFILVPLVLYLVGPESPLF